MIHYKVNTELNKWNIKHLYNTLVLENAKKTDIVKLIECIDQLTVTTTLT